MSETAMLQADARQEVGSKATAKLRQAGKLPAIVYGHQKDAVAISLDAHAFIESLHHGHRIFEVQVGGAKETVLIKELQYDHLCKNVIHADLVRVNLDERVEVQVPIEIVGVAKGLAEGGVLDEQMDHLIISCKVNAIPETIAVDVTAMGVGDVLHAGAIQLAAGFELVTDAEAVMLVCHEPKLAVEEPAEGLEGEAAAEPEVITEKKGEDASA